MVRGTWLYRAWWVDLVERGGAGLLAGARRCLDCLVLGSHREVGLQEAARVGVFGDSGAWETALLRLFDRAMRGGFWATLLPLSDQGIGERAAVKVGGLLYTHTPQSSVRMVFCLNQLLRGLLLVFGLLVGFVGVAFGVGGLV